MSSQNLDHENPNNVNQNDSTQPLLLVRKRKTWEQWSAEETNLFFEALAMIWQYMLSKYGQNMTRNKEQIRHFYYRTLAKLTKYIKYKNEAQKTSLKKNFVELSCLLSYGELRKKFNQCDEKRLKRLLREHMTPLIFHGSSWVKIKDKKIRIKLPTCDALKNLSGGETNLLQTGSSANNASILPNNFNSTLPNHTNNLISQGSNRLLPHNLNEFINDSDILHKSENQRHVNNTLPGLTSNHANFGKQASIHNGQPKQRDNISCILIPKTQRDYCIIQSLGQNPNIRLTVLPNTRISDVQQLLCNKWQNSTLLGQYTNEYKHLLKNAPKVCEISNKFDKMNTPESFEHTFSKDENHPIIDILKQLAFYVSYEKTNITMPSLSYYSNGTTNLPYQLQELIDLNVTFSELCHRYIITSNTYSITLHYTFKMSPQEEEHEKRNFRAIFDLALADTSTFVSEKNYPITTTKDSNQSTVNANNINLTTTPNVAESREFNVDLIQNVYPSSGGDLLDYVKMNVIQSYSLPQSTTTHQTTTEQKQINQSFANISNNLIFSTPTLITNAIPAVIEIKSPIMAANKVSFTQSNVGISSTRPRRYNNRISRYLRKIGGLPNQQPPLLNHNGFNTINYNNAQILANQLNSSVMFSSHLPSPNGIVNSTLVKGHNMHNMGEKHIIPILPIPTNANSIPLITTNVSNSFHTSLQPNNKIKHVYDITNRLKSTAAFGMETPGFVNLSDLQNKHSKAPNTMAKNQHTSFLFSTNCNDDNILNSSTYKTIQTSIPLSSAIPSNFDNSLLDVSLPMAEEWPLPVTTSEQQLNNQNMIRTIANQKISDIKLTNENPPNTLESEKLIDIALGDISWMSAHLTNTYQPIFDDNFSLHTQDFLVNHVSTSNIIANVIPKETNIISTKERIETPIIVSAETESNKNNIFTSFNTLDSLFIQNDSSLLTGLTSPKESHNLPMSPTFKGLIQHLKQNDKTS